MAEASSASDSAPTAWTPEPWDATLNGTFHHQGLYIGEVDDPENPKPGYASDRDVANAQRLVECVNALAGVPYPSAVPSALIALGAIVEALNKHLGKISEQSLSPPELLQALSTADDALRRLSKPA